MNVTVLVEGGGDDKSLKSKAAAGLRALLDQLHLGGRAAIEFLGGRAEVYKRFCREVQRLREDRVFLLLVDSEEPFVRSADRTEQHHRWAHVRNRPKDKWARPNAATDEHLHFMATAMETWIIADRNAIKTLFPKHYNDGAIGDHLDWEALSTDRVQELLRKATGEQIGQGRYEKGEVSFKLLGRVNPQTLRDNCPHANLFFLELEKHLGRKRST